MRNSVIDLPAELETKIPRAGYVETPYAKEFMKAEPQVRVDSKKTGGGVAKDNDHDLLNQLGKLLSKEGLGGEKQEQALPDNLSWRKQ